MEEILYLFLSVSLSSGRNIISKKTAVASNGRGPFFLSQTILFGAASLLLGVFGGKGLPSVSGRTVLYGLIYGVLLILSQWMLTIALKSGNTSVCTVIYSLGFLLPTVSGALFWEETLTVLNLFGILLAVGVIVFTAKKQEAPAQGGRAFLPFILVAMVSSGGLGIMQKLHQSAAVSEERGAFLLIAFLFAFGCSLTVFGITKEKGRLGITRGLYPAAAGLCFGGANLCNTILAGRMKSAVFFPLQNVSTILLSALLGIVLFKEKITAKTATVLLMGLAVIILFSI